MKLLCTVLIILTFFPIQVWADTHAAASCHYSDVLSAYNAASDGDTVTIPAGDCETNVVDRWDTMLLVEKGITFQGAGSGSNPASNTIIGGTDPYLFRFAYSSGTAFRVTGIRMYPRHTVNEMSGAIHLSQSPAGWRIDNNYIEPCHSSFTGCYAWGLILYPTGEGVTVQSGLIDNNTFYKDGSVHATTMINIIGGATATAYEALRAEDTNLGGSNFTFIEDNTFTSTTSSPGLDWITDCDKGGRWVLRHNTITNMYTGTHGYDSGAAGCRAIEIYENNFTANGQSPYVGMMFRSGTGTIYNNKFLQINGGTWGTQLYLINYRSCQEGAFCSGATCCTGSNADDGNDDATGWLCRDQVGAGKRTAGDQASEPMYYWNNCIGDADCTLSENDISAGIWTPGTCTNAGGWTTSDHIKSGRDYINSTKSGYSAYTYPHPLRGEGRSGGSTNILTPIVVPHR